MVRDFDKGGLQMGYDLDDRKPSNALVERP